MELELKLICSDSALKRLSTNAALRSLSKEDPISLNLKSVYFDSPDFGLRRLGFGLRVRRVEGQWVQTLKGGGGVSAGLHSRHEWEMQVSGAQPEVEALMELLGPHSVEAKRLRQPLLEAPLKSIFTTTFKRTVWQLYPAAGQHVEVAIDRGKVVFGDFSEPITEAELELKAGPPGVLYELASELVKSIPFRLGHESKASRGYALCGVAAPEVKRAGEVVLNPKMSVHTAFECVLDSCLEQIQGNERGVVFGNDVESVHQMRVGLRRLRCALRFMAPLAEFPEVLKQELLWLCAQLGAARDWEVLAGSTLEALTSGCPSQEGVRDLEAAARLRASSQRRVAKEAVDSERYARLFLALGAWRHGTFKPPKPPKPAKSAGQETNGRRAADGSEPIGPWAEALLGRLFRKLIREGGALHLAPPEERHKVRLLAKKLRYGLDFFKTLYAERPAEKFTNKLKGLQETLGWLNDVSVAEGLLRGLGTEEGKLQPSAQFALGWMAGRLPSDLRAANKAWRRFAKSAPPWRR